MRSPSLNGFDGIKSRVAQNILDSVFERVAEE
jgi:hypothetical protein